MKVTLLDCQQRRRSDDDNDTGPLLRSDVLITAVIRGGSIFTLCVFLVAKISGCAARNIITITV